MIQMRSETGEAVGAQRAVRATGFVVGVEHEVIHDELASFGEEVGQRLDATWSVEDVRLGDELPRRSRCSRLSSSP